MAESKDITANILIQAKVAGLGAIKGLSDVLSKTIAKAKVAHVSFMKFAKAGAALALGFEGIKTAFKFLDEGIKEAEASRKAQENLNAAIAHRGDLIKEAAQKGIPLESQGEALAKLADQMERAGVVSSTSLRAGFTGLIKAGFSPESINKMSTGFEGLVVGLKGVGASQKDVALVGQQINQIVKLGIGKGGARLPAEWKKVGVGRKELAQLKATTSQAQRREWIRQIEAKNEYKVADALGKTEGKLWRADAAWKRVQQTLGEPFAKTRLAFAQASEQLAEALEPIASKISDVLTPALEGLAGWFKDHRKDIEEFGKVALGVFSAKKWQPVIDSLKGVLNRIDKEFLEPVRVALTPIFKPIADAATKIWGEVKGPLGDMANSIKAYFKDEITWDEMWDGLKRSWDKVAESFTKFDYGKLGTDILNGIKTAWESINWEEIGHVIADAITGVLDFDFSTIETEGFSTGLSAWIITACEGIDNIVVEAVEAVLKVGKTIFIDLKNWAIKTNLADIIAKGLAKEAEQIGGDIAKIIKAVTFGLVDLQQLKSGAPDIDKLRADYEARKAGIKKEEPAGEKIGAMRIAEPAAKTAEVAEKIAPAVDEASKSAENLQTKMVDTGTASGELSTKLSSIQVSSQPVNELDAMLQKMEQINRTPVTINVQTVGGPPSMAPGLGAPGRQSGGLVTHPGLYKLAEKGSEMVIPMEDTKRARTLLEDVLQAVGINLEKINIGGTNLSDVLRGLEPGPVGAAENLGRAQQEVFRRLQTQETLSKATSSLGLRSRQPIASGPTNVSVSPVINLAGGMEGQAGAIQREVERAMETPVRTLLEQLKKARDEEHRLAYV